MSCSWLCAAVALGVTSVAAADSTVPSTSAYEAVIAPILRARCIECHGEHKQKAKLALHTWEAFARGSDAGAIVVAGKPDQSVLMERLRLPIADEEHMPPEDKPQPAAEEIALLTRWIERGASRTATVAELQLPAALVQAVSDLPAKLAALERAHAPAEPLWEFDPTAVAQSRAPLAGAVVELQRRFAGALSYASRTSAALHFTAAGLGRDFGDAELAALAQLRSELVWLDISGTSITDRTAPLLASFSKLGVLRAGFTEIGDATAEAISKLPNLTSVALPGTKVTAACVGPFTKMRNLRSLRLAGTAALERAQAANLPVSVSAADSPNALLIPEPR